MEDKATHNESSRALALRLYDRWVRQRQQRHELLVSDDPAQLADMERENFRSQLVEPREKHLNDLKDAAHSMTFADQVGLLVMMEIPTLETSTLLHRLSRQLAQDPEATYFSKVNMSDNCGCGCGCGCAAMVNLSYQEQLVAHHQTKPYSIDPFNELGTSAEVRDSLLVQEFLESFGMLSRSVADRVNHRYFRSVEDYGE